MRVERVHFKMKLGKNAPEAVVAHRIRWEVHSLEVASSERERSE